MEKPSLARLLTWVYHTWPWFYTYWVIVKYLVIKTSELNKETLLISSLEKKKRLNSNYIFVTVLIIKDVNNI